MENTLKAKCLQFLYGQVSKGNMPQIRKGMVEDLEAFIEGMRSEEQAKQMAKRFEQIQEQAGKSEVVDE